MPSLAKAGSRRGELGRAQGGRAGYQAPGGAFVVAEGSHLVMPLVATPPPRFAADAAPHFGGCSLSGFGGVPTPRFGDVP